MSNLVEKQTLAKEELVKFLQGSKVEKLNDFQIELFSKVCNYYGLNPFLREIHAIPTSSGFYFQVSYLKQLEFVNQFADYEGFEYDYGQDDYSLFCEVTVYRKNRKPLKHKCYAKEFLRETNNQNDSHNKMARFMLMKIAVSQAIRLAFPDMFKYTIYNEEEIALINSTLTNKSVNNKVEINDKMILLALVLGIKNQELIKKASDLLNDNEKSYFKSNKQNIIQLVKTHKFTFKRIDEDSGNVEYYKLTIDELVKELLDLDLDNTVSNHFDDILTIHSALAGSNILLTDNYLNVFIDYLVNLETIKNHYKL